MTFSPITIPHYLFQQKANISASRIDFLSFLTVVFKLLEYIAFHFTFTCYFILWRVRRSMGREESFKGWKTRSILLEYDINLSITFFFFLITNSTSFCDSVQFSSVTQSHPTLCNPMSCNTPGLPVHHQLQELTQTHAHRVGDAIQPSHHLSSPSPPALNPSQHQGLFQWVNSSHEATYWLNLFFFSATIANFCPNDLICFGVNPMWIYQTKRQLEKKTPYLVFFFSSCLCSSLLTMVLPF